MRRTRPSSSGNPPRRIAASDERGDDEDRRRADSEDPPQAEPRHAFASAFAALLVVFAFLTMKRSTCSRASSSRICDGGDFMR